MANFTINEDVHSLQHKIFTAEGFSGKDKRLDNIFSSKSHVINGKEVPLDFGDKQDFYKKAASALFALTKRGAKDLPGNVPFTADDIVFLVKEASDHPEFVQSASTPAAFAKALKDAIMDILVIASNYVIARRSMDKYKGKLAYELPKNELTALINAIKTSLELLRKDTGKTFKVPESKSKMPNEIVNATIDYIIRKRSLSKDPKNAAFNTVQKYSGNESLIWPSIATKIGSGDNFASLFSYLGRVAKGEERGQVDKIIARYKNKTREMITKKLLMDRNFRKQLKLLNKKEGLSKLSGEGMHISQLQAFARKLLKENPEYKSKLAQDGIKETALDEVVGMISLLIKNGALQIKFD